MKKSLVDRFWDKLIRNPEGCWDWSGSKDRHGYGMIKNGYGRKGSYTMRIHRLSWMLFFGPIPDSFCVCHICDNPSCSNPRHLFLGTHKENMYDRDKKGRQVVFGAGENHPLSKLTWLQVEEIRQMRLDGFRNKDIAKLFNVDETTSSKAARGITWKKP